MGLRSRPRDDREVQARSVRAHIRLVHILQVAWQNVALKSDFAKLDRYGLAILDGIAHVSKGQLKNSLWFEQIAIRHERRSRLIIINQPSLWTSSSLLEANRQPN